MYFFKTFYLTYFFIVLVCLIIYNYKLYTLIKIINKAVIRMKKFLILSLILFSVICVKNTFASESDGGTNWHRPLGSTYDSSTREYVSTSGARMDRDTGRWNDEDSSR